MTDTEKSVMKVKKYVLVAPDGGWGYMICAAAVIIFIASVTFVPCFGLIYNDILEEMGVGSTGVTLLNGIASMNVAIGGFLSGPLLKLMSLRTLCVVGCIIYNFGVFFLLFINSMVPFSICLGVFQGTGMGILYNLTFSMVSDYFVKKRLLAFSIIQTCTASFAMITPQIVQKSLSMYGYRGTLLVITAVGLHAFVGIALFQPVSWHMKKIELRVENELPVMVLNENDKTSDHVVKFADTRGREKKQSYDEAKTEFKDCEKSIFDKVLNDVFNFSTVKIVLTSISAWLLALSIFADGTFTLILPQAFYAAQWNENDVAMTLSLFSFGDLATRGLFILLSNFLSKITNDKLYIFGLLISSIGKLGMLLTTNVILIYSFVILIGVGRCFFVLLMPLVLSDVCPEKFTTVMGISLVFLGLLNIGLGPVVGAIRDFTDSYVITFYILTAINIVCMVAWSSILVYKTTKRKNNVNNKNTS